MIKNYTIKTQEDTVYAVIPEDIYLCEIKDLEEVVQKKYQSDEDEEAIRIRLVVADGEYKGTSLIKNVRPMINTGFEGGQPSALYVFLSAVLGDNFDNTPETINSVIGKNVRAVVKIKTTQKGKEYNHIADFMRNAVKTLVKTSVKTKEDIPVIEPEDDANLDQLDQMPF